MGKKIYVNIPSPTGGVTKGAAFAAQNDGGVLQAANMLGYDARARRVRCATRPGLAFVRKVPLDPDCSMTFLATVPTRHHGGRKTESDSFENETFSNAWRVASHLSEDAPEWSDGILRVAAGDACGLVRDLPSNIDTESAYIIGIRIAPAAGKYDCTYMIWARCGSSGNWMESGGVLLSLNVGTGGGYSGTVKVYGGSPVELKETYNLSTGTLGARTGILALRLLYVGTGAANVTVFLNDETLLYQDTTTGGLSGTTLGIGASAADFPCLFGDWYIAYVESVKTDIMSDAIVMGGGEDVAVAQGGVMHYISDVAYSPPPLYCREPVSTAVNGSRLFIADNGIAYKGTGGVVGGPSNDRLSDPGVDDWQAVQSEYGLDETSFVLRITNNSTKDVYIRGISSFQTSYVELSSAISGGISSCTYEFHAAPKVLSLEDATGPTLTMMTASAGSIPVGYSICSMFLDRMYWAGGIHRTWLASRQGDVSDYDVGSTTDGHAIAGDTPPVGVIGDPITALIPFGDDYMIMGTRRALWVMRGDPGFGGTLDRLSGGIGIVSWSAWCYGPNGTLFFMSDDGLAMLPYGGGGGPQKIGGESGALLAGLFPPKYHVFMWYDGDVDYIFVGAIAGGRTLAWGVDRRNGAIWPLDLGASPSVALRLPGDRVAGGVLLGCGNMLLRMHPYEETDNGSAVTSRIVLGPLRFGYGGARSVLERLCPVFGKDSRGVTVIARTGWSPEEAATAPGGYGVQCDDGYRNRWIYPRRAGNAATIEFSTVGRCEIEECQVEAVVSGRARRE